MTLNIAAVASIVLLVANIIVTLITLADRHARAAAWCRIAEERRWNHEILRPRSKFDRP